jgi:hypothetical protein
MEGGVAVALEEHELLAREAELLGNDAAGLVVIRGNLGAYSLASSPKGAPEVAVAAERLGREAPVA